MWVCLVTWMGLAGWGDQRKRTEEVGLHYRTQLLYHTLSLSLGQQMYRYVCCVLYLNQVFLVSYAALLISLNLNPVNQNSRVLWPVFKLITRGCNSFDF